MRAILALVVSMVLSATASAQPGAPPVEALDGVDVVVLLKDGKEVFGKAANRSTHEGFAYLFSSPETKAMFDKEPKAYAIQLGGQCARMGGTVTGNPSDYFVHAGKIYIFGSDSCRKLFIEAPEKYIPKPAPPMPSAPDAVARGRALLDKAAAAHGAAAIDGATTYVETIQTIQKRPTGDVTIVTRNMWRFPSGARSERTVPLAAGPLTITTLLTPAGGWSLTPDGQSRPMPPAALPTVELGFSRQLLPVLKLRRDPAAAVAALEPITVGGAVVNRVRVVRGALDFVLHVDAVTGRAKAIAYTDRGDGGQIGDITLTFGDFRDVKGADLPFAEDATFNGAPSVGLSRQIESADLNVTLAASLFTPPGAAK